jgi:hypothetical protein
MRTHLAVLGLSTLQALGLLGLTSCSSTHGARPSAGSSATPADADVASGPDAATGLDAAAALDAASGEGGAQATPACPAVTPLAYSALPTITKLPDPFLSMDGTRITNRNQWACRRNEISTQAQLYELGAKPDKPPVVTGSVTSVPVGDGGALPGISVAVSDGTHSISFSAVITLPSTGTPPYPAMIGIGGISIGATQLNNLGVATIIFPNDLLGQQTDASSRGKGAFYDFYGANHPAGAMMAWAWGVSRLIDALEQTPDAMIDPSRLGVTGCSRNGKGALIAGAFDERIALTIPQESGSGGSAAWRISDAQVASGTMVQTLSEITGENTWFTLSFRQFNNTATKLPFDHHMIEAMVAPRALLVIENTSQVWLGNVSTYDDSMAAHLVWEALGIPDHMGVSQNGDHSHCQWNGSQQPEVTAFVQKFLIGGGTASTNVLKTDGAYTFDRATWVDWDVPAL